MKVRVSKELQAKLNGLSNACDTSQATIVRKSVRAYGNSRGVALEKYRQPATRESTVQTWNVVTDLPAWEVIAAVAWHIEQTMIAMEQAPPPFIPPKDELYAIAADPYQTTTQHKE